MAPDAEAGFPEMADDMDLMQRGGFFACNVRGLRLRNVEVTGQLGPAFSLINAVDVDLHACTTRTPAADAPVIRLSDVQGAFVQGCRANAGTGVFLQVEGDRSEDIVVDACHLTGAKQPLWRAAEVRSDAVSC